MDIVFEVLPIEIIKQLTFSEKVNYWRRFEDYVLNEGNNQITTKEQNMAYLEYISYILDMSPKIVEQMSENDRFLYIGEFRKYARVRELTNTTPFATTIGPLLKKPTGKLCDVVSRALTVPDLKVTSKGLKLVSEEEKQEAINKIENKGKITEEDFFVADEDASEKQYYQEVPVDEIVPDGPVIFVHTHQSMLDNMVWLSGLSKHGLILHNSDANKWLRIAQWITGLVEVDRSSKESRNNSKLDCATLLINGHSMHIFSEATWNLSPNKLHLELFAGALDLARRTGAKIVPVAHNYTYEERNGKMVVTKVENIYGKPIEVKVADRIYPENQIGKGEIRIVPTFTEEGKLIKVEIIRDITKIDDLSEGLSTLKYYSMLKESEISVDPKKIGEEESASIRSKMNRQYAGFLEANNPETQAGGRVKDESAFIRNYGKYCNKVNPQNAIPIQIDENGRYIQGITPEKAWLDGILPLRPEVIERQEKVGQIVEYKHYYSENHYQIRKGIVERIITNSLAGDDETEYMYVVKSTSGEYVYVRPIDLKVLSPDDSINIKVSDIEHLNKRSDVLQPKFKIGQHVYRSEFFESDLIDNIEDEFIIKNSFIDKSGVVIYEVGLKSVQFIVKHGEFLKDGNNNLKTTMYISENKLTGVPVKKTHLFNVGDTICEINDGIEIKLKVEAVDVDENGIIFYLLSDDKKNLMLRTEKQILENTQLKNASKLSNSEKARAKRLVPKGKGYRLVA